MAFNSDWEAKAAKEIEDRGYSLHEIKQVQRKLESEKREWVRHFDEYIQLILHDESSLPVALVIQKASALADARQQFLAERFTDIPEDD